MTAVSKTLQEQVDL